MRTWLLFATFAVSCALPSQASPPSGAGATAQAAAAKGPFQGALVRLDGAPLDAAALQGKVVLVVNVASHCGFTGQYSGLQALHDKYAARGFTVLGVPCNQFGGQEPGSAGQIGEFCKKNYGVTFPLLEKQDVNGKDRAPLYAALVQSPAGQGADVKWNFEKFLVGRDGTVLARWSSRVDPQAPELVAAVEKAL